MSRAPLIALVLSACAPAGAELTNEAVNELTQEFAEQFQDCETYYEVGGMQRRGHVASWYVQLQVKGFAPKVLPVEVGEQDTFKGVEFRGMVSFSNAWTARERSKQAQNFMQPVRNARWTNWSDWKTVKDIEPTNWIIEKKNGQWTTQAVMMDAIKAAIIPPFHRSGDDLDAVKEGCSG